MADQILEIADDEQPVISQKTDLQNEIINLDEYYDMLWI